MIPRSLQITLLLLFAAVLGMGVYVVNLKRRSEQLAATAADQRPVAPPAAGKSERVTLVVAHDAESALRREPADVPLPENSQERARAVLNALLAHYAAKASPHPLAAGAEVESVFLLNNRTAVVNLNAALAAQHPSGVLAESLTVASLAQTLAANVPDVTQVKFLVDGRERETLAGHADLRGWYEIQGLASTDR